jgi:hypothetical protein
VLLVSVPYALKAGDAATVGGLPPSAFALATPGDPNASAATKVVSHASRSNSVQPAGAVTGSGTTNYVPLWTSSSSIGNSVVYQSGSGSGAKIGIHTTTPTSALDVKGNATISGLLTGQSAKFSVSNSTQALSVSESGSGLGIYAKTTSGKAGIYGFWNTQSSLGTGTATMVF